MNELVDGLERFRGSLDARRRRTFQELARGQRPRTLFITCSDSRVVPQLITDAPPGALFVVQNAGALVPPWRRRPGADATQATIEFAVRALKVRDVVICGHSECGAMAAVADGGDLEGMPAMRAWLRHAARTRRHLARCHATAPAADRLGAAVRENVLVQVENLATHPAVAEGLAAGGLRLHGWIFLIAEAEVLAYDRRRGDFRPADATQEGIRPEDLAGRHAQRRRVGR